MQLGDSSVVSVLVPKGGQPSSLYRIYAELQPVVNPLLVEVMLLREAQSILKVRIHIANLFFNFFLWYFKGFFLSCL